MELWKKVFVRLGIEDSIGFLREYNFSVENNYKVDSLAEFANRKLSFRLISFSEANSLISKTQNVLITQKESDYPKITVPKDVEKTSSMPDTGSKKGNKLRKDEVTEIESELQQDVIEYQPII